MRMLRQKITQAEREYAAMDLYVQCNKLEIYQKAQDVVLYAPLIDELSPWLLMEEQRKVKRFYLPVCNKNGFIEHFSQYTQKTKLYRNRWGVLEPDSPPAQGLSTVLIIVPCVALDLQGYRLGYGKGVYDRFLASAPQSTNTLYVAYACNKTTTVYPKDHDVQGKYRLWARLK